MPRGPWYPGAHSPLPYHSKRSTSPSGCGSSLTVQNEGHRPGYKQSSLIRASQVVLIVPRQLPRSLPREIFTVFSGRLQNQVGIPVQEDVSGAVYPIDRREHVVLPGLRRPLGQIGALAGGSVELVVENVAPGRGVRAAPPAGPEMGEPKLPGETSRPPVRPAPL